MSDHFHNLQQSPVIEHLVTLLDASTSAKDFQKNTEKAIFESFVHFKLLLEKKFRNKNVLLELSVFRFYLLLII